MLRIKNWKSPLALLALLSLAWAACNKDDLASGGPDVRVTFAGRITDDNDQPIAGAQVSAENATATTDPNGIFRLVEVRLPARNAILTVRKAGYFDFSRAYFIQDKALQTVRIQLLKKDLVLAFNSNQIATANAGGVRLDFPANSVAKADGSAYSGTVYVYARYLDPTAPDLDRHMPGDLRGISAGGEEQTLATFGMVGVELGSPSGDLLNIAAGKDVEITMPIPANKLAAAPATIPLWYYDTDKARWIEGGSAQKTGNTYVGKVTHFSFWNCDAGFPIVNLKGRVLVDNSGKPLAGATVRLTILSSGWQGYGMTDSEGRFGGAIPQNEALLLEVVVLSPCTQAGIYSQNIGPFANDATLPDMSVTLPNATSLTVSGRLVGCNQQPIANGYALLSGPSSSDIVFAAADGTFSLTLVWCSSGGTLEVKAYDPDVLNESLPLQFINPADPLNAGDIAVCNSAAEFIQVTLGTEKYSFFGPFEGLYGTGSITHFYGSGNNSSINFGFENNGQTGTFPLLYLNMYPGIDTLLSLNVNTQVTAFGQVGQPITGTFSGTVQPNQGPSKTVSGTYKVIRDN